ncbi:hypothetical protein EJ04DRAFT_482300 [Polyplosphaeria fusca]|uniref:Mitochondrial distribution and morphology protein 31 n=1 Tax=Polyplosphaeria fusca TaxID=682080 RepID=A0A9P4V8H9_9PLEO|nr:hypothetical protein EJ04DRAFT_482300 [Polyplosphaeria fusca]
MSRNVGASVGAFVRQRRPGAGLSSANHPSTLLQFALGATFPRPSILHNTTCRRTLASRTRPVPSSSNSIPFARTSHLGHSPARPRPSQTGIAEGSITLHVASVWSRQVHGSAAKNIKKKVAANKRNKSSSTNGNSPKKPPPPAPQPKAGPKVENGTPKPDSNPTKATPKHLLDRLPHSLPHLYRPTKAELLEAASGFWSRLKVHFKWFTIRSTRPFNADEIYALVSWVLAAHIVWIIVGTTTFFSLAIFMINSVFAQETVAQWTGNYLTQSSGIKVVFESAVVPKWKDGVISFKRVFVSRRPGQGQAKVSKGSQTSAAAAAAAIAQKEKELAEGVPEEEDTNYTQFDISIDTVNVTLSFGKWMNGKGLLKDVEVKGIRGVVDRTSVHALAEYVDPRTYKHEHQPGDFELDSFKMEDLLVTIYQPDNFRPYSVSIYSCDLPQLRKQWLFYDFLSANMMSGSFDNSLFTIHPRQSHNYTGAQLVNGADTEEGISWKKQSRIRIDGLNIDHLNRGYEGPFSWIYEGDVDIVADLMIPNENDESIAKFMSDFYDRMEATVTSTSQKHFLDDTRKAEADTNDESKQDSKDEQDNRFLIMDIRVHLNDVRAAVPIFTKDISYVNNALVRPIVAYINSKKTFIPVNCRVVKKANEFDGSWTIFDSGLMDDLSREMYDAFAQDVMFDNTARKRRIKKVGIWTLQLAAQALFLGLAGNIA